MTIDPKTVPKSTQSRSPFKRFFYLLFTVILLCFAGFICIKYYSFIFSRTIKGEIVNVDRIEPPAILRGGNDIAMRTQMFSFAVAIRTADGEIHTASSEDRQWAVAMKGICGEARFYPYPFWDLEKTGTWENARLLKMYDCPGKAPVRTIPVPATTFSGTSPISETAPTPAETTTPAPTPTF